MAAVIAAAGSAVATPVAAQDDTLLQTRGAQALRVFLDCQGCDFDYLRTELPFVNYVRDRRDAQVHVLITREQTGGGGRAITIDFVGLEEFAGIDDQVIYFTTQDDTDDDERNRMVPRLKLRLMQYAV